MEMNACSEKCKTCNNTCSLVTKITVVFHPRKARTVIKGNENKTKTMMLTKD